MFKVFSIKQRYSERIFSKKKRVEFRRQNVSVKRGDVCLIYTSSPVKRITGYFVVKSKIREPVKSLWRSTEKRAGMSKAEFEEYFEKCDQGTAIMFEKVRRFKPKPSLEFSDLKKNRGFRPPQSYSSIKDSMSAFFKKAISDSL